MKTSSFVKKVRHRSNKNFLFLSKIIILRISQSRRCVFFSSCIAQFSVVYVDFSEINMIRFVNLSVTNRMQFNSFFVFDRLRTKFMTIVWNDIDEEWIDCRFSHDLWRLIYIWRHCEQCRMYWRSVLISSFIYHDRDIISKQASKFECFWSWVIVKMFDTQFDEMHKRFSFVNLLTW
jgi:hypothetical protein